MTRSKIYIPLRMRPRHARWAKFLLKCQHSIDVGAEMDYAMCSEFSRYDTDKHYEHDMNRFGIKFGISVERAIDEMIAVYGIKRIAGEFSVLWSCRLMAYAYQQDAKMTDAERGAAIDEAFRTLTPEEQLERDREFLEWINAEHVYV